MPIEYILRIFLTKSFVVIWLNIQEKGARLNGAFWVFSSFYNYWSHWLGKWYSFWKKMFFKWVTMVTKYSFPLLKSRIQAEDSTMHGQLDFNYIILLSKQISPFQRKVGDDLKFSLGLSWQPFWFPWQQSIIRSHPAIYVIIYYKLVDNHWNKIIYHPLSKSHYRILCQIIIILANNNLIGGTQANSENKIHCGCDSNGARSRDSGKCLKTEVIYWCTTQWILLHSIIWKQYQGPS